jgi:MoaA/NifB/PqqE/SkfB family radical SAM enzyme
MEIKTAIVAGYECNNNCRFCYDGGYKRTLSPMTTQQIKSELSLARERGSTFVDILGGEPTIRRDIFELVRYCKRIGFKTISLTTNGKMFYYRDFAKRMLDAGMNSVVFSIHGHIPGLHDYLTRSRKSFNQATQGIRNLKELSKDIYICTNTVIIRDNYKHLPQIAENNALLGADGMEFMFIHPRGHALRHFDRIVPTLTEIMDYLQPTVHAGLRHGIKHTMIRYVPMCYMLFDLRHLSEFDARKRLREQHVGPEFKDLEVEKNRVQNGRVKGPQCEACRYFNICEGIFKEYADRRGFEELVPV